MSHAIIPTNDDGALPIRPTHTYFGGENRRKPVHCNVGVVGFYGLLDVLQVDGDVRVLLLTAAVNRMYRSIVAQAVHPLAEVAVVVGLRLYETVEGVGHLSVLHHDRTHGAYARRLLVGCLKVDGYEVNCRDARTARAHRADFELTGCSMPPCQLANYPKLQ